MSVPSVNFRRFFPIFALLLLLSGAVWLGLPRPAAAPPAPVAVNRLASGTAAAMDSPVFAYQPQWNVSPAGADTREPARPWQEPSGRVTFAYTGQELALQLALGAYWGYIFVTVDGRPANRLPVLPGNPASDGQPAGYKPLLAPEKQTPRGPAAEWVVVHRAADNGPHRVAVEVWRGWGQTVLRGVAVDALPPGPRPLWPGVALLLLGLWGLARSGSSALGRKKSGFAALQFPLPTPAKLPIGQAALPLALAGLLLVGAGVLAQNWLLTDGGLLLLAVAGLLRLELWTGALLFALPFYLHPLPILPGLGLNLIEIGVWGGLAVAAGHWLLAETPRALRSSQRSSNPQAAARGIFFALLLSLALVAAVAAEQRGVALREWRTLFLAAGGFALLLHRTLATATDPAATRRFLALAWLLGGTAIALSGIWQYATEQSVIQAEGVNRVRAFYGSPNNLALYLERTAAVGLALLLFARRRVEILPLLLTAPQLLALLLTFSKGALFLALPALLLALALGGARLLRARGESLQRLWGLVAVAVAMGLGLLPFLSAERFRALLDFRPQTTGGVRLNLWRSSLAMALDHPWLGVGPDNFLYKYRSGYILPAAWRDPSLNHPHNFLLDWWTRLGLPGLALAGGWLGTGVAALWRASPRDALAVGALGAVAAGLAHGLIDASYALPDLLLVWVFLLHLFPART